MWAVGFRKGREVTNDSRGSVRAENASLSTGLRISLEEGTGAEQLKILEIDCHEVRRELVNYMEEDITPELRARIDHHFGHCGHCTAVYDGARNVVQLLGRAEVIELPHGFSQRLYQRFLSHLQ